MTTHTIAALSAFLSRGGQIKRLPVGATASPGPDRNRLAQQFTAKPTADYRANERRRLRAELGDPE